jgi:DNA-directed RNA polymerase specialized sigma subunit
MKEGRFSNAAKLDIHQVKDIQKKYGSSNVTMKELANEFNVTETHICRLVKDVKTDNKKRGTGSISEYCNFSKINEEIATRILILYMSGEMTQKMIAEIYNLHQSTVSYICTGKTWKHLFQGVKQQYNKEILKIEKL